MDNSSCILTNIGSPLSSCEYFEKIKILFSPNDLTALDQALCYNQIVYNNTVYKINHILTALFDNTRLISWVLLHCNTITIKELKYYYLIFDKQTAHRYLTIFLTFVRNHSFYEKKEK
ncbi:Uncharacterized protein FWK35_00022313 [Aphis craccivora]|uniref:Uncharacterized protein n=1 Tax=Aphis craccivora TaxID=307492 RepID=A0A6G0VVP7_APHCR|nr:Uncharacterized protein FWK35_00022313 [Aphis craccivora]